ncbi:EAL domain-containing protein [Heyndrickxia coagulans]|uniref:EAL domain, c-di-GMP-specific phosphodiesterase class I (Or its enzymatically inactive variant) n=1 Tax=Heyndrickxia coagulans DSM 1 = ATCC 7050 TaxID=1121088 RepID=A0A8B4BY24_HEYCO|nr:EAL domain-containing protein [Heyndrickxia coagulans]AJH77298.1 EAL domain protein [Heyndrickxia coagulans DSM 1 = ATCC 7050]MCR2846567.1 EAL domain-containing protein [Heyndrickxia coagulans]MDR4224242.1 EAL domain-containing protein [Heyndrickxia coagulans DSM 1 = ATCC 7050]MED4495373.1 EAL domain-containing protein [Heyndrickxia coagulans]MED4535279.1 EAL domain-containing protein [Heyndrickxia coagulans]
MLNEKPNLENDASFHIPESGLLYIQKTQAVIEYMTQKSCVYEVLSEYLMIPFEAKDTLFDIIKDMPETVDLFTSVHPSGSGFSTLSLPLSQLKERIRYEMLVKVIISDSLTSYFQPIIRIQDNQIYGYESLLRTRLPNRNIPPGLLFDAAHKTGLHSLLDLRAREAALKARAEKLPRGVKSFINFLPASIYDYKFCLRHTFTLIEQYDISPEDLVFEVVETEKINDIHFLKKILGIYRDLGVSVALDDLGSGYATLETLKILNPNYVKIDRFFISHCDENKVKQRFLQEVMKIAGETGIYVLAEGIEREEELLYCKSIGMHLAQGYYIGKPAPEPAVTMLGKN